LSAPNNFVSLKGDDIDNIFSLALPLLLQAHLSSFLPLASLPGRWKPKKDNGEMAFSASLNGLTGVSRIGTKSHTQ